MFNMMKFLMVAFVFLVSIAPARADLKADAEAAYSDAEMTLSAYEVNYQAAHTSQIAVGGAYLTLMQDYGNWTLVKQGYVDTFYVGPAMEQIMVMGYLFEAIDETIQEEYMQPAYQNLALAKSVADTSEDPEAVEQAYKDMIYYSGQALFYTAWANANIDTIGSCVSVVLYYIGQIESL